MRRVHRHHPRAHLSVGLLSLAGASGGALAADQPAVEEIVVTATRREEALQDVAAAVAVVDPQEFAAGGVNSLSGVLAYVPGVVFNDNGAPGQGSVTMRGVANIFATPSVGIYVDDIPYGSVTSFAEGANFALDSLLGDVERIEVIKGPQGTLFGAASMGGSMRYITREPNLTEVEGRVAVDLSDTTGGGMNQLYRGRVSVPLVSEKLALSLSGFYQDNEGFIDEANRPGKNVNDAELRGGQATLLYQPTEPLSIKLNYSDQEFEFANTNGVPFDLATGQPIFGRYQKDSAGDTPTSISFEMFSGTIEYEMSWATATLASSWQEFAQNATQDLSAGLGPFVDGMLGVPVGTNSVLLDFDITTERWVEELRLTSPSNGKLEWIAGLYYTEEDSSNFQATDVQPGPLELVTQEFPSSYKEFAAFGNITYYFTEQLDATLGLRLSSNDMSVQYSGTGVLAGPTLPRTTVSDDVQTYLFNLRYRPSEETSLYMRIANGYRPASANLGLTDPNNPGNILSVPFVKADTLWSYEVGAKGNLADGALSYDVAVYHINWKDLQVFRSFMGVSVGGNADSDVTANGVEAALNWRPVDALTLNATAAYAISELDEDDPSIGGLEGEQLPGIPKWTFSLSGNYRFPLGQSVEGFVGGGVSFMDKRKSSFNGGASDGVVIAPSNPNYTADSYTTADLRVGATFEHYEISLYATNLFNEYAYQRATTNSFEGTATILRPRTIGAVISVDF